MSTKHFRVLAVDDEVRILNFIKSRLKADGYEVITAADGLEGLEKVHAEEPDLILLDVVMPKMNGIDMLKELRTFSRVPVIILSAKGSDQDRIAGLDLGADDYLPKPFNPDELSARIKAVRRRVETKPADKLPQETMTLGEVKVDFKTRSVSVHGEQKHLTRIEWLLICELAQNAGRLMTHEDLLTRVWGAEYRDDVHLLRTWVSRLRYKLEQDPNNPKLIGTVPKVGYIIREIPSTN